LVDIRHQSLPGAFWSPIGSRKKFSAIGYVQWHIESRRVRNSGGSHRIADNPPAQLRQFHKRYGSFDSSPDVQHIAGMLSQRIHDTANQLTKILYVKKITYLLPFTTETNVSKGKIEVVVRNPS
jgi:hypothetical protein